MVVQLTPFNIDTAGKFKHVRKMAMFNPMQQPQQMLSSTGMTGLAPLLPAIPWQQQLQQQQQPLPQQQSFLPTSQASAADKEQFLKSFLTNKAIQSEMGRPIEDRVTSNLTRDMVDIAHNQELSDYDKTPLFLNALKRYMRYKEKKKAAPFGQRLPESSAAALEGLSDDAPFVRSIRKAPAPAPWAGAPPRAAAAAAANAAAGRYDDYDDYYTETAPDDRAGLIDPIIGALYSGYRTRSKKIMQKIIEIYPQNELGWNSQQELIMDGKIIRGTHLGKLLRNIYIKKPDGNVLGFNNFVEKLRGANLIGAQAYKQFVKAGDQAKGGIIHWED